MTTDASPRSARPGAIALLLAAALLASLYVSWRLLAAADFLYPVWYDHAGIGAHIDRYAPQNRYRSGFGETSRAERLAAFAAIGRAVRDDGRGLETLTYTDAAGTSRTLLRPPEIVHLQDVARLVTVLEHAGLVACVLVVATIAWLRGRRAALPPAGRLFGWTGLGVGVAVCVVLLLGPRNVFYHFHVWVFPEGHQWFFYYQDSLMSTLMKAPYLFGYIAVALVVLTLVLLAVTLAAASRLTATRRPR